MAMNPIRVTYAAAATGAQTGLAVDWRDVPSGCSYEVQFNAGASGTVVVESTLDNVNDPSITPDWVAETGSLTADTRGVIGHPIQFIRLNITGAIAGGTLTFKVLAGTPIGDTSGVVPSGGGAPSTNVNLVQVGGAAITEGQKTMAASVPVVIASDQSAVPTTNFQTATGTSSTSFTCGTTAYLANDVVGASGANAALTFAAFGPASANMLITGVQLEIDTTAIISGETGYLLYLYNVTPPSAINDSSPWDLPSGDRASWLGGPITIGNVVDIGSTLYIEANSVNKQVQLAASGSIFGYLVSVGAYTPTARVFKITLHGFPV